MGDGQAWPPGTCLGRSVKDGGDHMCTTHPESCTGNNKAQWKPASGALDGVYVWGVGGHDVVCQF